MSMTFLVNGTQMRTEDGRTHTIAASQQNLSSNGTTVYTLLQWSNGALSCNCPGWAMKKTCKHTKAAERRGGVQPQQVTAPAINALQVQAAATASQPQGRRVVHVKS